MATKSCTCQHVPLAKPVSPKFTCHPSSRTKWSYQMGHSSLIQLLYSVPSMGKSLRRSLRSSKLPAFVTSRSCSQMIAIHSMQVTAIGLMWVIAVRDSFWLRGLLFINCYFSIRRMSLPTEQWVFHYTGFLLLIIKESFDMKRFNPFYQRKSSPSDLKGKVCHTCC